jgi:hypothetical protein
MDGWECFGLGVQKNTLSGMIECREEGGPSQTGRELARLDGATKTRNPPKRHIFLMLSKGEFKMIGG